MSLCDLVWLGVDESAGPGGTENLRGGRFELRGWRCQNDLIKRGWGGDRGDRGGRLDIGLVLPLPRVAGDDVVGALNASRREETGLVDRSTRCRIRDRHHDAVTLPPTICPELLGTAWFKRDGRRSDGE